MEAESSESSVSATEFLRHNLRQDRRIVRNSRRQELLERRRGVEAEPEITAEQVRELAVTLRRRGATDLRVLARLQAGLLGGPEHVAAFMSTDGALTALVKHLTGLNPALELKAAYCLCNLALTGGKTSAKIAKSTAPYLIAHIDGMNPLLQDACVWAVGNLAGSSEQAWTLLHTQGVLSKLLSLLHSPHADVTTAAVYALTHFITAGSDKLSCEEMKMTAAQAAPLLSTRNDLGQLLFVLSSIPACDEDLTAALVPETGVQRLCGLVMTADLSVQINVREVTFLVRTLANLSSESTQGAQGVIRALAQAQSPVIRLLLEHSIPHLKQETLWFLANLLKHSDEGVHVAASSLALL